MVDHHLLHKELAKLALVATPDFDLHEGLHALTVTAAAALDVDGAGITLHMPSGDTEYVTATDPVSLQVEEQQDALKQGACIDAIHSGEVVAVGDLANESRWPEYRPAVLEAGFHAVAGVPIPFQGRNLGAINLYANSSRAWTTDEFDAARLLAGLAAGYLINTHLLATTQTLAGQLQQALNSRIIIEQAKGLLAGRHAMTPDAAFEIMRGFARSSRMKIHDVASRVVSGKTDLIATSTATEADDADRV